MTTDAKIQISGCTPGFEIPKIGWRRETLDGKSIVKLADTAGTVLQLTISKVYRENFGKYFFQYLRSDGSVFYQSEKVEKSNICKIVHSLSKNTVGVSLRTPTSFSALLQIDALCCFPTESGRAA